VQAIQYTGGSHPLPLWAILTVMLVATRAAARFVTVRTTATERVLVIGEAATAALVKRKLRGDPGLDAEVIGRVGPQAHPDELGDRSLGRVDELPTVLERHRIERVVVAPTHQGGEDVVDVIRLPRHVACAWRCFTGCWRSSGPPSSSTISGVRCFSACAASASPRRPESSNGRSTR
jgi:hypothetical protein